MASSAKDLLNFSFDSREFKARGGAVYTEVQQREKRKFIQSLDVLVKDLVYSDIYPPKDLDSKKIIAKLKVIQKRYPNIDNLTKDLLSLDFKSSELRRLSYILYELADNQSLFGYANLLLKKHWSDSYFKGVLYVYLCFWRELSNSNKDLLFAVVHDKLEGYNGRLKKYLLLKENMHYLKPSGDNGPRTLGLYAYKKLNTLLEMPGLFSLRENAIVFSYFDRAIYSFYVKKIAGLLDQLSDANFLVAFYQDLRGVLDISKSDWVCKMVISEWIIKSDVLVKNNLNLRNLIERSAHDYIGDTLIDANWTLKGADIEDTDKLNQARKILKRWDIQEHISVFFKKCVTDPDRLDFWLRYIDYIDGLKIIGSASIKEKLMLDDSMKKTINSIFIETDSSQSQTSALAMHIHKYIIVEFSDTGAVYVYKDMSEYSKFFSRSRIGNIRDLKQTQLSYIVYSNRYDYYFYDEGRLPHQRGWQDKLSSWLHNMAKTPKL